MWVVVCASPCENDGFKVADVRVLCGYKNGRCFCMFLKTATSLQQNIYTYMYMPQHGTEDSEELRKS